MRRVVSISRVTGFTAGLAIVLSSCGIQNQAGVTSPASTKTKNFALLADGQFCFDTEDERQEALNAALRAHDYHHYDIEVNNKPEDDAWHIRNSELHKTIRFTLDSKLGGCPAPVLLSSSDLVAEAAFVCVTPEQKQSMIDGYKEQLAKTEYPIDWSAATIADYQDQMKRGLANAEIICTKDK